MNNSHPRLGTLLVYFGVFFLCATVMQVSSDVPPHSDGAPIEYFTGGVLWMLSLTSLLIAGTRSDWRRWFWFAASAGLALLAMDEIFAFHERVGKIVGDDDHLKVAQWAITGGILYAIDHFERPPRATRIALLVGFLLHGMYILVDVGDGDYFRIPFISLEVLWWSEEFLELLTLTAYLMGFLVFFSDRRIHTSSAIRN